MFAIWTSKGQVESGFLGVGGNRLANVPAAVTEGVSGRSDDGLLPLVLFKSLYLNARAGYAVFDSRIVRDTASVQMRP